MVTCCDIWGKHGNASIADSLKETESYTLSLLAESKYYCIQITATR